MPELPEVESYKHLLDTTALHKRIDQATVTSNPRLLMGIASKALAGNLEGKIFQESRRHGKYLFVLMDEVGWLILHFGMSGKLAHFLDTDPPPPHICLDLSLDNGGHLAFIDPRTFGKMGFTEDLDDFLKRQRLGPDAKNISESAFKAMVRVYRGAMKSLLMSQNHMAGLGNLYVDELLFQTGIHPLRQASSLTGEELERLYPAMHEILDTVIAARKAKKKVPAHFLLRHRKAGKPCPRNNGDIQNATIAGRSTYYCPGCQIL
jgi:formamidopyrimidine-DNA glycosylase